MDVEDDKFFLIEEEIAYFKQASEVYPERILKDFTIKEPIELIVENTQEFTEIASEIRKALSYILDLNVYDEAQQILLGTSYNPYLMWLFLKKKEFIDKLITIRESKLREAELKDRKVVFLSEVEMKELISSRNILDVIDEYTEKPINYMRTRNINCPLPGHIEKTGSFHIYEKTNSFYCFGCRRGGGIVQFVKHLLGISDKEAFKELFPQH